MSATASTGSAFAQIPSLSPTPSAVVAVGSGVASPAVTTVDLATSSVSPIATRRTTTGPTPRSTASPSPVPVTLVDLRYDLVARLGRPLFCDPDFYPVARTDEAGLARERLPAIQGDGPVYAAITAHLGIDPAAAPTDEEILAIYREWKMLNALVLGPTGGVYSFDYIAASAPGAQDGWHVLGTVDPAGTIRLTRRDPSGPPPCPICLARGTSIATPGGLVAVQDLRVGMTVWTADTAGRPIRGRLILVGSPPYRRPIEWSS